MRALGTAATGMKAMSTQQDIIANNIANISTTGFKRSRALFQDLFYQQLNQPGTLNGLSQRNPSGVQIGLGVQLASTMDVFEQGDFKNTGRDLDVAIQGKGFFKVKVYDDVAEQGIAYTRAGVFFVDSEYQLVAGGPDGFKLEPPISIPSDAVSIDISSDGVVNVTTPGSATPQAVATMELATFTNPEGLLKIGKNLYAQSASSGDPVTNQPGTGGAGLLAKGHLEQSNVGPVRELTNMIETQRAFELNGRVIETADEMLQVVNSLKL